MARLPRGTRSSISTLFLISYLGLSNLALAQLTLQRCTTSITNEYTGLYTGINAKSSSDTMSWCPLWAAVCNYVSRNCKTVATCKFTNFDSKISGQLDPSSSSSYHDFLHCTSCDVEVVSLDPQSLFVNGIPVPTHTPLTTSGTTSTPTSVLLPGESPDDVLAENSFATFATRTVTVLLVLGSIVGSLIAVRTGSTNAASFAPAAGADATAAIPILQTGSGSGQSVIDAVTLLLHFQSISTSGLLSISYPVLYRYFSYNFAWANLIIPSEGYKSAARSMGANLSCLYNLSSLGPENPRSTTGMATMGARYDLESTMLGGLVYLITIIGVAISLAVFVLAGVVLRMLNAIFSKKLQAQVEMWPSRASSMSLRLFVWVLGSVSTFAIYQFVEPCSTASLIAFASVEFILIILTLLAVSVFIIKTAKAQGPEALFRLSESEESKYSRKWGSLYAKLKPALYWFFISDYVWVLAKSVIVGAGQDSGLAQVCALIGLELATLFALLIKRPYGTSSGNAFHISSACKRVFTSASLLVFWDGFLVPSNSKRILGIILMTIESVYAAGLFVALLLNGGAAFVKWNSERKERRRAHANEELTTGTSPIMPHLHHTDSYFSNTASPLKEKF